MGGHKEVKINPNNVNRTRTDSGPVLWGGVETRYNLVEIKQSVMCRWGRAYSPFRRIDTWNETSFGADSHRFKAQTSPGFPLRASVLSISNHQMEPAVLRELGDV